MLGPRLCITKTLREKVMKESHEPPYEGHRSAQPTIQAMEVYFFWLTMRQDVNEYISQCMVCQKVNYDRHKSFGLLQLFQTYLGKVLPWILSLVCPSLFMEIMRYGR